MHFIAQLYKDELETIREQGKKANTIALRGYSKKMWIAPELRGIKLPVNTVAYNLCITGRDLYLERVKKLKNPETWERYTGRVIDSTYKLSHQLCEIYISRQKTLKSDLETYLVKNQNKIINQAKREHSSVFRQLRPKPNQSHVASLDSTLRKIIKSEAKIALSLINFEIGRVQGAN